MLTDRSACAKVSGAAARSRIIHEYAHVRMRPERGSGEVAALRARPQARNRIPFLCPAREENDLTRIENRSDSHRDRVRRHRLIEKKTRVGPAGRFTQRNDVRAR